MLIHRQLANSYEVAKNLVIERERQSSEDRLFYAVVAIVAAVAPVAAYTISRKTVSTLKTLDLQRFGPFSAHILHFTLLT